MTDAELDDLQAGLRCTHNDTWPTHTGLGDLVNPDGPEAADAIDALRRELADAKDSAHYANRQTDRMAALAIDNAKDALRLKVALNDLLNDCINFDGGKLTDCIMAEATKVLHELEISAAAQREPKP